MSELKDPLGIVEEWRRVESGITPTQEWWIPLKVWSLFLGLLALAAYFIYWLVTQVLR